MSPLVLGAIAFAALGAWLQPRSAARPCFGISVSCVIVLAVRSAYLLSL